jgi:hypothetical protein
MPDGVALIMLAMFLARVDIDGLIDIIITLFESSE